jgi:hypothetical protein
MRRLVLTMTLLLGAACTPGSGEYGSCTTTPECQVNLECKPVGDAGVCRYTCDVSNSACSAYGEVCGPTLGLCSKDGGY